MSEWTAFGDTIAARITREQVTLPGQTDLDRMRPDEKAKIVASLGAIALICMFHEDQLAEADGMTKPPAMLGHYGRRYIPAAPGFGEFVGRAMQHLNEYAQIDATGRRIVAFGVGNDTRRFVIESEPVAETMEQPESQRFRLRNADTDGILVESSMTVGTYERGDVGYIAQTLDVYGGFSPAVSGIIDLPE